jgi:hypothetical protein
MSPQVTAAIIAGSFGVVTLIGTLAAQYFAHRATSRDTRKALKEQRRQLERTLGEQRGRTLNERFATAAEQLGSDKAAVRLAGVYAMAGQADDWKENRQTCVNVLCAYLRMPYEPDPGSDSSEENRLAFQMNRELRHTVISVIADHLQEKATVSWKGLDLDFSGSLFDGGSFSRAEFSGGTVHFTGARFSGGTVDFSSARFSGSTVSFAFAKFSGGDAYFGGAQFSGGKIFFAAAEFSGGTVDFTGATDWSVPPAFPWTDTPAEGVKLPPGAA